jgi:hypothetical protein
MNTRDWRTAKSAAIRSTAAILAHAKIYTLCLKIIKKSIAARAEI